MFVIRELTDQDIPEAARLLKNMWMSHVAEEPRLLDHDYINNYDSVGYITKYSKDPNHQIFVATAGEKVVGVARVEIQEFDDMHNFKKLAYFDDLVVSPGHQRQGIASALTDKRIQWAKDKGIAVCQSKIYAFNEPAQKLAEKHGFEDIYHFYYNFLDN